MWLTPRLADRTMIRSSSPLCGSNRWRSPDGRRLYEWDDLHGEIEGYNKRGKHVGVFHAVTGALIKPAVRGRTINV